MAGGGGGVLGRSAKRCVACGSGGEDVGLPFLCVADGLRVPGVKKLCVLPGFGVFAGSCLNSCSKR